MKYMDNFRIVHIYFKNIDKKVFLTYIKGVTRDNKLNFFLGELWI